MSDPIQLHLKKKAAPPPPALGPSPEDSDTQALSEALESSFFFVKIIMALLVVAFLFSGFFKVDEGQRAIRLRFGKPVGEDKGEGALLGPGLHAGFPAPIDTVKKVSIGQTLTATSTVGWYAISAEDEALKREPEHNKYLRPGVDGYLLTSDANIVHASASLRYHVTEPVPYLFDYVDAGDFITNALNNSLIYAASKFAVDDILIHKATAFREKVEERVRELISKQKLGIVIDQVSVKAEAPLQVKAKFGEVLQAGLAADDAFNKANSYTNEVLSKARAEADSRINMAMADRTRMVGEVEAQAKIFNSQLPRFNENPDLFISKRQTEVIGRVMANAKEKFAMPAYDSAHPREVRVLINREPAKDNSQAKP